MNPADYFPTLLGVFFIAYLSGFFSGLILNALNYFFKAFHA